MPAQDGFQLLTFESNALGVNVGTHSCEDIKDLEKVLTAGKDAFDAVFFSASSKCEHYQTILSLARQNKIFCCEKVKHINLNRLCVLFLTDSA